MSYKNNADGRNYTTERLVRSRLRVIAPTDEEGLRLRAKQTADREKRLLGRRGIGFKPPACRTNALTKHTINVRRCVVNANATTRNLDTKDFRE